MACMSNTFILRTLANDAGTAMVSDHGAHLTLWKPASQSTPVVWQPKSIYLGEETAIRGGIPVIFPWFNGGYAHGEPTAKKPKHGFARVSAWTLDEDTLTDAHARYTLDSSTIAQELLDRFISGPDPHFYAELDIHAADTLGVTLRVENTGDTPIEYEAALHTYFQVSDVTRTRVAGLEHATYLDGTKPDFPVCQQGDDPVAFDGTVLDRIYYSEDELRIEDEALGRTIVVGKTGSPQTVVWNPGQEGGDRMADMRAGEWRDFVCVEAAANRDRPIVLAPGESHTIGQSVRVA
ncbi:D-hexose-6-phosphate mutarotase [Bifidobacterium samirii]|uniref:Putative glucose-6-phosphate 1-epimerase n=2 Tax=Bifidobacterium samirii TaxID=2306974 RepID=A0A430FTW0_9BIFI|nr:D-hexose-6-phosphate mutarotase [Bifidobacterium samirii]